MKLPFQEKKYQKPLFHVLSWQKVKTCINHILFKLNVKCSTKYLGMIIQISYSFFQNISCFENVTSADDGESESVKNYSRTQQIYLM
jgi:hypothetical protein